MGYREIDPLGGYDPYSASKACSELISSSYSRSFFSSQKIGLATARAGNVIGGGDWSKGRLMPDIIRAMYNEDTLKIRYPNATRPWQHVLEPIDGYLKLTECLYSQPEKYSSAWNFGPSQESIKTVRSIVNEVIKLAGTNIKQSLKIIVSHMKQAISVWILQRL